MANSNRRELWLWIAQLIVAFTLIQTLRFKFTGDPLAIHIFSTLGVEPWGRFFVGALELVTGILLAVPSTAAIGAFLAVGLMLGAIFGHLTRLGIVVQGDGGGLFGMAIAMLIISSMILYLRRRELPLVGKKFK